MAAFRGLTQLALSVPRPFLSLPVAPVQTPRCLSEQPQDFEHMAQITVPLFAPQQAVSSRKGAGQETPVPTPSTFVCVWSGPLVLHGDFRGFFIHVICAFVWHL